MHSTEQLQVRKQPPKCCTVILEFFKDSFSLRYNWSTWLCESAYVCTALPAMQSVVVDFVTVIFLRTNDLPLENKVLALSWKLYTHVLQPKLHVIICCNVRLMYYPSTPILDPPHTPKKTIVRWNQIDCSTCLSL